MIAVGIKPNQEIGKCFKNDNLWAYPLLIFIDSVAPDLKTEMIRNDGLNKRETKQLAEILKKELKNGRIAEFEKDFMKYHTFFFCEGCEDSGKSQRFHKMVEEGHASIRLAQESEGECIICKRKGKLYCYETHRFTPQNIKKFVKFLEHCGGFRVYDLIKTKIQRDIFNEYKNNGRRINKLIYVQRNANKSLRSIKGNS